MSAHERERLSGYLDGELDPAARAEVEAHLAACPECTALLADFAAVDEAAAALPAEAPAGYFDSFPGRVRGRLEARPIQMEPRGPALPVRRVAVRHLPAWTWAVAAAVLLAVITPLTLRQGRPAAPADEPRASSEQAPAVIPPPPSVVHGGEAGAPPEPPPARRAVSPARPSAPAPQRLERPFGVQAPAIGRAPEQRRDQAAEGRFAAQPNAPAPAEPPLERQRAAADAEPERAAGGAGGGVAGGAPGGVVEGVAPEESSNRDKLEGPAPRPAVQAEAASPMMSAQGVHEAKAASLRAQDADFHRLEAARPGTAAGWRRVCERWKALAAAETDPARADEERVRAIIAAREAWKAEGDAGDLAAFRSEADSYLRRDDARQKPRVEGMLAEAPLRTP